MSQIAGEPATQDFVEVRLPAAGPTCRCCVRPRPASRPVWTSPSTRSRTCASRSTRPARSCCSRPCRDRCSVASSASSTTRSRSPSRRPPRTATPLAGHLRLDRAVRARGQGLLRRGRGQDRVDQPLQTARRGTRAGVRSEDGPVRDEERGTRELPAGRVPDGIDGIPEQARPHPEDDSAGDVRPGGGQPAAPCGTRPRPGRPLPAGTPPPWPSRWRGTRRALGEGRRAGR